MQFTNLIFLTFLAGLFTTEVFALKSHCTNYFCNGKNAHMPCTCQVQRYNKKGHMTWVDEKGACGHKDLRCET
ncbi:unnamed protein product [Zymoseptoria tritici ST99CH_3D7]|uniref:Extracellular membrane protein CFEM domain-containing protein n=2 Tax=Zymoseptoria tritici TaxID=1047171 RepID=A0A1X7RV61_ZYMT9|nr:unnamed protein product [Zymoseptoria tritici ST99CH_3D7]SMR53227.1 unnamed protein product [Zymoseptoria tritici ST99CH_1E4]